jgi:hypothetical protein
MPNLALEGPVEWKPAGTAIYGPQKFAITFDAT